MVTETPEQEIARLKQELAVVRRYAREMHSMIGWARGQFGSIAIASDPEDLVPVVTTAKNAYEKMEEVIGNVHYRAQLWVVDEATGGYKPRGS